MLKYLHSLMRMILIKKIKSLLLEKETCGIGTVEIVKEAKWQDNSLKVREGQKKEEKKRPCKYCLRIYMHVYIYIYISFFFLLNIYKSIKYIIIINICYILFFFFLRNYILLIWFLTVTNLYIWVVSSVIFIS